MVLKTRMADATARVRFEVCREKGRLHGAFFVVQKGQVAKVTALGDHAEVLLALDKKANILAVGIADPGIAKRLIARNQGKGRALSRIDMLNEIGKQLGYERTIYFTKGRHQISLPLA